jgi:hypothetical protein
MTSIPPISRISLGNILLLLSCIKMLDHPNYPPSCSPSCCLVQIFQKYFSKLQTASISTLRDFFSYKKNIGIGAKCMPSMWIKGICVPLMAPIILGKLMIFTKLLDSVGQSIPPCMLQKLH